MEWSEGAVSKSVVSLTGDRGFESTSLQRRVRTKPTHRRTISAGNAVLTGDRWFESISLQQTVRLAPASLSGVSFFGPDRVRCRRFWTGQCWGVARTQKAEERSAVLHYTSI